MWGVLHSLFCFLLAQFYEVGTVFTFQIRKWAHREMKSRVQSAPSSRWKIQTLKLNETPDLESGDFCLDDSSRVHITWAVIIYQPCPRQFQGPAHHVHNNILPVLHVSKLWGYLSCFRSTSKQQSQDLAAGKLVREFLYSIIWGYIHLCHSQTWHFSALGFSLLIGKMRGWFR